MSRGPGYHNRQPILAETERGGAAAAKVSVGTKTHVAFVPQDLPVATIDLDIPSSVLQDVTLHPIPDDVEFSPETFVEVPTGTPSSPTLSISTVSDLTPTELDEDTGEGGRGRMTTRHDIFYFEDGNVEIVSEGTIFRVHSTIVSFSSPKLRDILSRSALIHAPTPEGPPRITVTDSAVDFATLLRMIYTPGRVSPIPHAGSVN